MTRPSAEILPFPRGPARTDDAQARLQRALLALESAVAAQRSAVAGWRASLGDLHSSVERLGGSLQAYQSKLGGIGAQLTEVAGTARRLEAWADAALAQDGKKALTSAVDKVVSR